MSSSARTQRNVRATSDMIKNSRLTIAIWSIARYADHQCARFIALSQRTLRGLASTVPILNSYAQLWISRRRHAFNARVIHMFDRHGTLQARAPQRAHCEPPQRRARWVAAVIGISLFIPMAHASSGSIDAIKPKDYIRMTLPKAKAICLIRLYGKESAFNPYAIGNLSGKYHTYGIPQLKNALIADKTAIEQIHYGLKYIDHRYDGDTCKAWSHWLRKGWH